ncbi:MAG: hypothetical protein HQL65_17490 [Magnetococcales bacterium]|nr:hypothetical protein [Magnetococcales bacterium]
MRCTTTFVTGSRATSCSRSASQTAVTVEEAFSTPLSVASATIPTGSNSPRRRSNQVVILG